MNFQLIYQIELKENTLFKILIITSILFSQVLGSEIPDIRSFSLREKVAQMIMVRVRGEFYNSENWYKKKLKKWIKEDGIGGIITF